MSTAEMMSTAEIVAMGGRSGVGRGGEEVGGCAAEEVGGRRRREGRAASGAEGALLLPACAGRGALVWCRAETAARGREVAAAMGAEAEAEAMDG
jgi:hypothetical protein